MRQSVGRRLRRRRWLHVEAGLFDLRKLGLVERVEVLAEGRDHVLVEHRGERHAIPKNPRLIGSGFALRLVDDREPGESELPADALL